MKNTNDLLERLVDITLRELGLEVIYPDQSPQMALKRLDFYVPQWNLYIECKAWGSSRLHDQVENVHNCIVLIGIAATTLFCDALLVRYKLSKDAITRPL